MKNYSFKTKIIVGSDLSLKGGEGILGNDFIKSYSDSKPHIKLKKKFFFFNFLNKKSFFHKYLVPILISLYVRINFNKNFIYVNYLPLWNFLIFLILPKNTVLGPITGSNIVKEKSMFNKIVRKLCFPVFNQVSILIIKKKFKKVIFSTNLLKKNFSCIKDRVLSNYVFNNFKFQHNYKKIKKKKNYDLVFYYRKHKNKVDKDLIKIIENLSKTKKISIIGDKLVSSSKNIINFGNLPRKKATKIMNNSKFAICGLENLYSLFAIDAYNNKCMLIVDKSLKNYVLFKSKNFYFVNYKYSKKNLVKILKIMKKNHFQIDLTFKKQVIKKKNKIEKFIKLY